MAAENPFKVDVGLWKKDPDVGRARLATRGAWLEILMVMHERDGCGEITGTLSQLASDARCSAGEMRTIIEDLNAHSIADVTERNGIVTLINRKMRREYCARKSNQTRQQRHRARARHGPDNGENNAPVANAGHVYVVNTQENNSSQGKKEELSSRVQVIFSYWQEVMNHPQSKLTQDRARKIRARLDEKFTIEQLKQAVDGCRASEFHMGGGPEGRVFDDIELICRQGSNVEKFIGVLEKANGKRSVNPRSDQSANEQSYPDPQSYRGANVKVIGDPPKRV